MRAVITGCAGFIGSTPRRAARRRRLAGDRGRLVHAATTTRRQGGATSPPWPTSRASTWSRADVAERRPRRAAGRPPDGRPPRRPAGRARQLRRRLRPVRCTTTSSPPSACSRPRAEAGCRAGRVRLVVVGLRRRRTLPLPRGHHADRAPFAVRRHQARVRAARRRLSASSASRSVGLRYFTVYGPRQRPDMAIRRLCEAATRRAAVPAPRRRRPVRDFTHVDDAVDATVRAMHRRATRRRC